MTPRKHVTIWTDGACAGNPGPGGFAAVLVHGEHRKHLAGGFRLTTNNRMELMAVIASLRALKFPCAVTVYSDARYVVDGVMTGAMRRWGVAGWRRGGGPVPNADLWAELAELCERHDVTLTWVAGHAGEDGNECCDRLAAEAALAADLPADEGYERRGELGPAPTLFDALDA
jgi:ribonuclease HI